MPSRRIIIIGGGFAGVQCARTLRKRLISGSAEIVLFSRENNMVFYPLLAEVAGASISPMTVTAPLRQMLPEVRCRTEEVHHIDVAASEVEYEGYDGRLCRMAFDHAVLACGAAVNLTMIPGMADHAFPLKSVGDAVAIRFHVMAQLEKAEVCSDPERRRWLLSFVVVGGGFSGVEMAGEINDLVRASQRFYTNFTPDNVTVTLVHSRQQILPEVASSLREFARVKMEQAGIRMMLNRKVVTVTPEGVGFQEGDMLKGATVVCTIGTTMPELVQQMNRPKKAGRLCTDSDMRLCETQNVWAIGDCARVINAYDNQPSPPTGQFAERQGRQVAENIVRVLRDQPTKPFSFRPLGQLCSIGERNAVAEILGFQLSGFLAWWIWRTVYLLKSPSWSRRLQVASDWTWELLFPRDLAYPRIDQTERIARAHYRPGDYIFHQGEPATNFYVIEQGEVEILQRDASGQPAVVGELGPGDFFGEISLLDGTARLGSVRARTAVEVVVTGKEIFSNMSRTFTPFRTFLAQALRWRRLRLNPRLAHQWALLDRRPLSQFMEAVPAQRLSSDDTFESAIRRFDEHALSFLCVVEDNERLDGIIGRNELFEAFAQGKNPLTKVHDFMRSDPIMVTPIDTGLTAGDLMNKYDLDWLPVVDAKETRRLIGIVRSERMLRQIIAKDLSSEPLPI
ncbi:MAG TPA: FAD-dependent oxidoreductase [Nitrospira sp.]|nr:FAD-dependent oxidoreductase [Nitrospira sp.]